MYKRQDFDAAANGWAEVEVPRSWTTYWDTDFTFKDFTIYTNTQMPWQSKYDTGVYVPKAPTNYNPVGLYRKTFTVGDDLLKDNNRIYIQMCIRDRRKFSMEAGTTRRRKRRQRMMRRPVSGGRSTGAESAGCVILWK